MRCSNLVRLIPIVLMYSIQLLASSSELMFPIEKNRVQVLPQRFEYQLIDESRFRIGDLEINLSELSFQLVSKGSEYKFRFRWPAQLVKNGEIVIKDNTGKAIFIYQMKKDSGNLDPIAKMDTPFFDKEELAKLEYYPFFKFCAQKQDSRTKIYLCSKDLYLKKTGSKYTIHVRDSFRQESFVEINGRNVGPKGIIFLNNLTEAISMRALMLSGANFEIDTRKKVVDFKDLILSENSSELIIRAEGAEPVDGTNIKRLSENMWQTTISVDRPTLYLKGEGDIPMRQEFIIDSATIRSESVKIFFTEDPPDLTYYEEVNLTLKNKEGLNFTPYDNKSRTTKGPTTTEWTLLKLQKGLKNRRYISVSNDEVSYVGASDIERGYPFDISANLSSPLFYSFHGEWWPTIPVGIKLSYASKLKTSSAIELENITDARLKWRFNHGLHFKDSTYGLAVFNQSIEKTTKASLLGLSLYLEQKTSGWLSHYADWIVGKIDYPFSLSGISGGSLKTSWSIDLANRNFIDDTSYWNIGLEVTQFGVKTDTSSINLNRTLFYIGYGSLF